MISRSTSKVDIIQLVDVQTGLLPVRCLPSLAYKRFVTLVPAHDVQRQSLLARRETGRS